MTLELRALAEIPEIRSAEGGRLVASGIAIRYGVRSKPIMGQFVEEIRSGAVTKSLQERDVMALHEHDRRMILGRLSSGTLRVFNSDTELRYEIDLPDTTAGRDVAQLLERGDVKGTSFGFKAVPKEVRWSVNESGMAVRSVGTMSLDHIATTCAPVYADSPVELALRSLADERGVDVRSVLDAAEAGDLASVISSSEVDDEERSDEDELDPAVAFRRPVAY